MKQVSENPNAHVLDEASSIAQKILWTPESLELLGWHFISYLYERLSLAWADEIKLALIFRDLISMHFALINIDWVDCDKRIHIENDKEDRLGFLAYQNYQKVSWKSDPVIDALTLYIQQSLRSWSDISETTSKVWEDTGKILHFTWNT